MDDESLNASSDGATPTAGPFEPYGVPIAADSLQNMRIGKYAEAGNQWLDDRYGVVHSIRFRASENGSVSRFRWYHVFDGKLVKRQRQHPPRRRGKRARQDRPKRVLSRCNGYACGDSSLRIKVELREDDDGEPSTTGVLAEVELRNPFANPEHLRLDNFTTSALLTKGETYHLVFSNLSSQGRCDSEEPDYRDGCRFTGVDHLYLFDAGDVPPHFDHDSAKALLWDPYDREWSVSPGVIPTFEIYYEPSSEYQGQAYAEVWVYTYRGDEFDGPVSVEDSSERVVKVRQNFTYSAETREIASVYVRTRKRQGGGGTYPQHLKAELFHADGTLIGIGERPVVDDEYVWVELAIADPETEGGVTLTNGEEYFLTFSKAQHDDVAGDEGAFELYPLWEVGGFQSGFSDGYAEYCVEETGGCELDSTSWKGWKRWGEDDRVDGDLQFYLTG